MTTPYEKAYPAVVPGVVPADVKDSSYTVPQLEAKQRADQEAVNSAAASTATSKFDS